MKEVQLSLFSFPEFYDYHIPDVTIIPKERKRSESPFEFKLFDFDNIKTSLPKLYEEQAFDVFNAEKRFFEANEKGKLFTNGTGTGKTLVGLGIIKRFILMGKGNILIIVPTDQKCKDWIEEALDLDIYIHQLQNTSDFSPGVNITTYANFYQNDLILNFHQDLVVYDESHNLVQNEKGDQTVYLAKHKEIAKLPTTFKKMYWENKDYYDALGREKMAEIFQEYIQSTKVLFLSASPFAYIKSLIIGDGTLWPIYETNTIDDLYGDNHQSYNEPGRYENFFIENFGYRMRTNKLTVPESGVNMNLMERLFYEKYKKIGAISGRQINIDKDYSREFILLDSEIGNKIDEGLKIMSSQDFEKEYPILSRYYSKKWRYHFTRQLLETIKAKMSVERIRKHLSLNRKVVVFHDYNEAYLSHPFRFSEDELITREDEEDDEYQLTLEIKKFEEEYPELINLDLSDLVSPIALYKQVFAERVAIYNGTIPKKKRKEYKDEFNNDNSFVDIIVIQRKAGKEGISLHDVTGERQRVLIELGLPTAPTDCIQVEGRIYRIGSLSNAIYEYLTIQTAFERMAYAHTIAERSRTAENLSMGEKARNMEIIFKEGYQNPIDDDPNPDQGIGGKEKDNSLDEISEFEKSISLYFSNMKKSQKTKSKEGKDYFATPEPLGFKMVEWLYGVAGNRFLEPSAGHGAIGRFFPSLGDNTFVEPSIDLSSKLRLNIEAGEVVTDNFEKLSRWNKFDKIAMNPPFGTAGKLAAEHLKKAIVNHLYKDYKYKAFSRLIAIIPDGPSMDKRVQEFSLDKDFAPYFISHEILLPACTFERAGTSVICKIVVVDCKRVNSNFSYYDFYNEENKRIIDLRHCKSINDFFKEIEHIQITHYNE